jgi:hypothetical protein
MTYTSRSIRNFIVTRNNDVIECFLWDYETQADITGIVMSIQDAKPNKNFSQHLCQNSYPVPFISTNMLQRQKTLVKLFVLGGL